MYIDTYRVYADGSLVFSDEFDEYDDSVPYDDYGTYEVTGDFRTTFNNYPIALIHDLLEGHPSNALSLTQPITD